MASRIRMICAMQENSLSRQKIRQLEAKGKAIYRRHFGDEYSIIPIWVVIPRGQAFLAAQPSTATTVSVPVKDGTDNGLRHAFMSEFCQMWIDITQCDKNEIIFNVSDISVHEAYQAKQLDRINPRTKPLHMAKLVFKTFKSKVFNGYFSMNINISE